MSNVLQFRQPTPRFAYFRLEDHSLSGPGSSLRKGDVCKVAVGLFRQGEVHAVRTIGGQVLLKHVTKDGEVVELTSANPDYPVVTFPISDVHIIGCAVEFLDGETGSPLATRPLTRVG